MNVLAKSRPACARVKIRGRFGLLATSVTSFGLFLEVHGNKLSYKVSTNI